MQELFTLQRWRRISALKEHQPVPQVNVKGQEGGEGTEGEHFDSWTTPVSEGDVLLLLQHSIPHPSPSVRPAHSPSPLSIPFRVVSNALDLPLDSRFSRHLFGGGVLCATELQYFISRLSFSSSSSSTADIASSSFRPRASRDGLYSFFTGSRPGSEVGDLYIFLNENGFDAVNRRRKREREALDRMKGIEDRHRDYHHQSTALSLPLFGSVSSSPGCTMSNRDTGSHLNGCTSTISTSSKGIGGLHNNDSESSREKRNSKGSEKAKLKRRGGEGEGAVRVSVSESTYSSFFSSSSVLLCEDAHSCSSAESTSDEDADEDKEGSCESKDEGRNEKKAESTATAPGNSDNENTNKIESESRSISKAIAEKGVRSQEEESTDVEEAKEHDRDHALAARGAQGQGHGQREGGRCSAAPISIPIPSRSRDWSVMSPSNARDSQTSTEAKTKSKGPPLPHPHSPIHSHSDSSYRPIGKALTVPGQRTGIADLMPLSVQLEISVSQPLRRARASELYSAVTSLREKHLLGTHFKCECSAVQCQCQCKSFCLQFTC
jgi:hypothetical protein